MRCCWCVVRGDRCEKSFSLTDVYGADEVFVTGTFADVVPMHTVDEKSVGVPFYLGSLKRESLRKSALTPCQAARG